MKKWIDRFNGLLLALMFLITFYQILARDVFIISSMWTEELARFLFVWIVFLGSATLLENNEHIRISIVLDRIPKKVRQVIEIFSNLAILAFGVMFVWSAYMNILNNWMFYAPSMDWMRLSYLYLGLFISGVLMIWYLLVNLARGIFPGIFKNAPAK
jgi:TRAP-type C4-dicarboxylate transport system permease small subunit